MRLYKTQYGSIEFSEGLKIPLAEFMELYNKLFPFCYIAVGIRDAELKKAHKIATDGNIKPSVKKRTKVEPSENGTDIISENKRDREGLNEA